MSQAKRDENAVTTLLATDNTDGVTPVLICAEASTHALCVDNGTTGSDLSDDIAGRDQNAVPVLLAVSSVDGVTPVEVYGIFNGTEYELMVDST